MINPEIKEVYIPACAEHEGQRGVKVKLRWVCPVCGQPRGKIKKVRSYDGSLILFCDGWSNPCGHVDKYDDVIAEAKANGLNDPVAPDAASPDKRQNDCPLQLLVDGKWICGKISEVNVDCPDMSDFRACGDYPYKKRRAIIDEIIASRPLKVVKCKSCGADITWIETQNGRSMPCNFPAVKYQANRKGKSQIVTITGRVIRADVITDDDKQTSLLEKIVDGEGYISHFATCPYADSHRRR